MLVILPPGGSMVPRYVIQILFIETSSIPLTQQQPKLERVNADLKFLEFWTFLCEFF
jgi:hypothetical protein